MTLVTPDIDQPLATWTVIPSGSLMYQSLDAETLRQHLLNRPGTDVHDPDRPADDPGNILQGRIDAQRPWPLWPGSPAP